MSAKSSRTAPRPTGPRRAFWKRVSLETVLWVAVAGLVIYRVAPQARAALGLGSGGSTVPALTLPRLDGGTLNLAGLRGQVVLVNFWATWCPPCRFEMPGFEKVYRDRHADGFTIVGISADQGPSSAVKSFLRERAITYPVAMATAEAMSAFGGVNTFPTSFLVDRKGVIRYTVQGIFAETTLRQAVQRLLDE